MSKKVHIAISRDVWRELRRFMVEHDLRSLNEAIRELLAHV